MAILEIKKYGDPVLREKAHPITEVTEDLKKLSQDMIETMYDANGIGLAANQVGILQRIFVVDTNDPKSPDPKVYLNPEIQESSVEDESYNEGCLSIPDLEGDVYRPLKIKARWMGLDGKTYEQTLDDMNARVFQHELDHLDGVLFIDHMTDSNRQKLLGKLNKLKRDTMEKLGISS